MKRFLRLSVAITGLVVVLLSLAVSAIGWPRTAHASGMWNLTGSMNTSRSSFTLTQLPNGKVLAVGGVDTAGTFLSSAELYNPATGVWAPIGSMSIPRFNHTATLLPNGEVLVAGGSCSSSSCIALASAELYNPATGTWSLTGSMHVARFNFSANKLGNGDILVAGGDNGAGDCCTASSTQKRGGYSTVIPQSPCFCPHGITSAELYTPSTGMWRGTGSLNKPRTLFTATSIPDGTFRVLVAGGITCNVLSESCTVYSSAEVFDPTTGKWTLTGRMHVARSFQSDAKLKSGVILVAGGDTATAELFTP